MSAQNQALIKVLEATRRLLALSGNDFAWSRWQNTTEALAEVDRLIMAIRSENLPARMDLQILFAPTGSIQEVSLSSGWGDQFLLLAMQFDAALEAAYA